MADIPSLMNFGMNLLQWLPQFLFILQILVYLGFISFFGWIVMLGYRTYSSYSVKFILKFGFGFVSLVCGIGISDGVSGFLNFNEGLGTLLRFAQADVFAGGVVSSVVLSLAVFLITRNIYNIGGLEKAIKKLEQRLEKARRAEKSKLLKNPGFLLGVAVFFGFIVFSVSGFRGFPNFSERIFQEAGISPQEITDLFGSVQNQKSDCVSPLVLFQFHSKELMNGKAEVYENQNVKDMFERESGENIKVMYRLDYQGEEYILGITESKMCSSSEKGFCSCFEFGNL
ncbi:MAG: hypothetical protein DRP16_00040 [Candidatus Aenigmatarchaeota archaeon]|nr:MAG: hypothetical protein DRP16_00040 [Candidatus Aenigmarchaeota archaeon]